MCLLCRCSVDITLQYVTPAQVTSCDHMIKQSCNFADRKPSPSHHSAKFDGHTLSEKLNVAKHENCN